MIPKDERKTPQKRLFAIDLEDLIDKRHPLAVMAERIDWKATETCFEPCYSPDAGQRGLPIRLQVGLQILKEMYALSDEVVVARWVENPYWQYFCGEQVFVHKPPMDDWTMGRFRRRIGKAGARQLVNMSIKLAESTGVVKPESFRTVVVDTTVMTKAVAHPTDSRLMGKALLRLVEQAKAEGCRFRQTYSRQLPTLQRKIGGYAHARQYQRMHKAITTLHNYLGRVVRDLRHQRGPQQMSDELRHRYAQAIQLLLQTVDRKAKNKLYSLHEPDIVCIAKGKSRTPYEFGHKVSVVTTADEQLVLDCQALKGNPYDGHTLDSAILRTWKHTGTLPKAALVDKGYKGSQHSPYTDVHITGKRQGLGKAHPQQHRRNSIEPIIGHIKADGLLERCHLKGFEGAQIHALLCGMGKTCEKS